MINDWMVQRFDSSIGKDEAAEIICELEENLRQQDLEDLTCLGGDSTFAIIGSIDLTEEGYIYRDKEGRMLCIIGVAKAFPEAVGRAVWMLGTRHIMCGKYIKSLLIKESQRVVQTWVMEHGLLYNCVNKNNTKSIRWLTWLGAHFLYKQAEREHSQFVSFYIHEGK